jgi:nucleotide-binding universal stress UspA family protein
MNTDEIGPVVVGVDGSDNAHIALECAAGLAKALGAELLVVHAVGLTTVLDGEHVPTDGNEERIKSALHSDWCRSIQGDPELHWHAEMRFGSPADVLLGAADSASFVVVGSRGIRNEAGLLGSTSHHVVHRSPCPVVVVPHETAG